MRLRSRLLSLTLAPDALCVQHSRAVPGTWPQHHRTAAPPCSAGATHPAKESRSGPPAHSAWVRWRGGRNGEGRSRTDARVPLLRASPALKPPASYLRPYCTGALRSSFLRSSSLRGAATQRPQCSRTPRSCAAPLGSPVP
ncbi:hypothetical protein NDU88_001978 [Pleurodeles waltl]|uniref:Secreted protein n=1 Tax=Pleurodeles waltl TaxID=8319 RepID=A0AAV7VBZ1_PLEWA|nr:hypothetical protein NDU88_001978 [Pleurodeles waltl]